MTELLKAWKNGKRGKFRRIDGGKLKFIRSHDGKIEKTSTCVCKSGEPCTCEVEKEFPVEREITEGVKVCKFCGKTAEEGCTHGVEKNEDTCDCTHEGVCKDDVECKCDCTDRATCEHRAESAVEKLDGLISALEARQG